MAFPFDEMPRSPFARLQALLADTAPGRPPIAMSVGEPQHTPPALIAETLAREAAGFGRYPVTQGTAEYRTAVADWLARRYDLPRPMDAEHEILPLAGTREGLFSVLMAVVPEIKAGRRPAVLIPNPFYQCYAAGALAAGAEPVYCDATRGTGFLPDLESLPEALLARTAAIYLCSPSNPEGAVADRAYWEKLFRLADVHAITVLADECYAEIYDRAPPPGALEIRGRTDPAFTRTLAFHSLSKRSSAPGLRAGFVAGDARLLARFREIRNNMCPTLPNPLQAAAAACWRDEAHVEANRALYRAKFDLADRILGDWPGFYRPAAGFFLWLEVPDSEAAARHLWQAEGLRVLPGTYLAREQVPGDPATNPARRFIRVALVNDLETTEAATERLRRALSHLG